MACGMETEMTTYRDILARRGIRPMRVEESTKAHGDLVLDSWCRPVRVYGSTGSGAGDQTTRAVVSNLFGPAFFSLTPAKAWEKPERSAFVCGIEGEML